MKPLPDLPRRAAIHRQRAARRTTHASALITRIALLCAIATAAACSAFAADADVLSDCRTCHRARAPSSGEVPVIEGQHADYLELQLHYFRERHRDSFPMGPIATEYGARRAAVLAAEVSALPWTAAEGAVAPARASRGGARARELGCETCHGEDYVGGGVIPRLAGQRRGYLERQLRDLVDDLREHPEMPGRSQPLGDDDVAPIAAFLATTHRQHVP